jgi:hypothetical protein
MFCVASDPGIKYHMSLGSYDGDSMWDKHTDPLPHPKLIPHEIMIAPCSLVLSWENIWKF